MALMASMSATWPYRLTGMMAFVRGVIAASISAASMLQVSGSMSTNTGLRAEQHDHLGRGGKGEGRGDDLVAGLQAEAISAISSASVPLATVMQCARR
jgi:hypothetical protein